jgi:hypothetical protein
MDIKKCAIVSGLWACFKSAIRDIPGALIISQPSDPAIANKVNAQSVAGVHSTYLSIHSYEWNCKFTRLLHSLTKVSRARAAQNGGGAYLIGMSGVVHWMGLHY